MKAPDIIDEEVKQLTNEVYKCPSCGANLKYDPENGVLKCDYCGHNLKLKGEASSEEFDFLKAEDDLTSWSKETKILHCQNCGANNVVQDNQFVKSCPFCNSSLISSTTDLPGLRPNRVIPFKISEEHSIKIYQNWLKKHLFAPSTVKKTLPNPETHGVYLPTWTYDTITYSEYEGRLGERYTVVVGSGKNRRVETRIRYFRIRGIKQLFLDDILVASGKKINQKQLEKLSPFDTNNSFVYDNRFLSGFSAEHYDITLKEGWQIGEKIAKREIERSILSGYRYDVVDYLRVKTTYDQMKYKYVLLPIWICSFQYHNKTYRFYVNGETGRLDGKAPISPTKIIFLILIIIVLFIIVIWFFTNYSQYNYTLFI